MNKKRSYAEWESIDRAAFEDWCKQFGAQVTFTGDGEGEDNTYGGTYDHLDAIMIRDGCRYGVELKGGNEGVVTSRAHFIVDVGDKVKALTEQRGTRFDVGMFVKCELVGDEVGHMWMVNIRDVVSRFELRSLNVPRSTAEDKGRTTKLFYSIPTYSNYVKHFKKINGLWVRQ